MLYHRESLTYIVPGRSFCVYIANFMAKPDDLLKFMIMAYTSSEPPCIINEIGDESNMIEGRGPILMQGGNFYYDLTTIAVLYELSERQDD